MGPDAKALDRALYEVMDTIQHDWARGPIDLEPSMKFALIQQLKGTRSEINELLSRLESAHA
ncbi:MAG TPA: hypothetical protein VHU18_02005 [Rhizomicrobium sp.]|jgi:hypothetical protein|nr:hypothetical protein [Rhizomicrobium sp.]